MTETLLHIIERCRRQEAEAEKILYFRFAPRIIALTRRYARDEAEALDYLQECFIVIFDKLDQYQPEKGNFEPWMFKVCTNVVLQILRKKNSTQFVEIPENMKEEEEQEPSLLSQLNEHQILEAIRTLPEGYRAVFNLYVFEQWSHRDIAHSLGITESASRSQLTRARKVIQFKLRQITSEYEQRLV